MKIFQRARKINGSIKSLVERLVDFDVYASSVLGFVGSISAPDEVNLKEEALTAGPHNSIHSDFPLVGSMCALGSTYLGSISSSLPPGLERPSIRAHSPTALRKFMQLVNTTLLPFTLKEKS